MCEQLRRGFQGGVSHVELIVSVTLFAIFLMVFLDRAFYYQELAEKAAMEMTVANMRTGLRYKVADLMLKNQMSEIPTLADENPMNWLAELPESYLGEFEEVPNTATAGRWFYDRRGHELVYTVNNRRHFVPFDGRNFTIRYRPTRVRPGNEASSTQVWVNLVQVQGYTWMP